MKRFGASLRQTCVVVKLSRSVYLYRSQARDATALTLRIKEIAATRVHYGYRRVHVMLRREGWKDNHKRVYRLYRTEGLSLQHKRPKRNKSARLRQTKHLVRALTVVDAYTRECLAIEVSQSLKGEDVVQTLERITGQRGWPGTIKADNGSEFISKAMDRWAYENSVELDFSRPGKPTDNAKIESFNGRLREECLNAHWFLSLDDAKCKIEAWRRYYNEVRPHTALDWLTPAEFACRCGLQPATAESKESEISSSDRY